MKKNETPRYIIYNNYHDEIIGELMTKTELKHFIKNNEIYDYLDVNSHADLSHMQIFKVTLTNLRLENQIELIEE